MQKYAMGFIIKPMLTAAYVIQKQTIADFYLLAVK